MDYFYIFPVGDWSGDGHAFVAEYLVKGNCSLQELRKTHLSANWIGNLCENYGEKEINLDVFDQMPNPKVVHQFMMDLAKKYKLNVNSENQEMQELLKKHNLDIKIEETDEVLVEMTPDSLIQLWVFLLNQLNSNLNLEVVSPAMSRYYKKYKGYPTDKIEGHINFYGFDSEGCHLETPGYGVWGDDSNSEFYLDCN